MTPLKPLTAAVLAIALSGCAGAPALTAPLTPGGVAAAVQQSYDWAAAMTARHSGGKVALPAFDATKVQAANLPFKVEGGKITLDAGVQNAMLRLAQNGQAQLFANGSWFQIPLPAKAGYAVQQADAGEASFVMLGASQQGGAQPAGNPMFSFILAAIENGAADQEVAGAEDPKDPAPVDDAGETAAPAATYDLAAATKRPASRWKVVGGDGPDDMALVEGARISLDGGGGNDALANLGGGAAELLGGAGDDDLDGGAGQDWLDGGEGDDDCNGGAGADYIDGGAGGDKMYGGEGDDFLDGGDGVDMLDAGAGADDLYGGGGDDELVDGAGEDDVFEGDWDDENGDGVDDDLTDDAPEADDEEAVDDGDDA